MLIKKDSSYKEKLYGLFALLNTCMVVCLCINLHTTYTLTCTLTHQRGFDRVPS